MSCSDCGAPLQDAFEDSAGPAGAARPAEAEQQDAAAYVELAGSLEAEDAGLCARQLADAGLRFTLVPGRRRSGDLGVRVHEQDAAAAEALLRRASLLPPIDESAPVSEQGGPCPACGTRVEAGTLECGECGLVLGGDLGSACVRCGLALPPGARACPDCGQAVPLP